MSELKAKIAALTGAAAMAAGLGLSVAASANADTTAQAAKANSTAKARGYARCPAGYFCIFDYKNGFGTMAYFKWGSPDLRQQRMDNKTTSVWNRSGRSFTGYNYANYREYVWNMTPGSRGNVVGSNLVSSVKVW